MCFCDDVPMVLKPLAEHEWARVSTFHAARLQAGGAAIPHLAPFELLEESGGKRFLLMPRYIDTLATYERLTDAGVARLWQQLRDALDGIHALGFAHMDVKPSNICVTAGADFFLIDVGSIAPVGSRTHSSLAYLPMELQPARHTILTTADRSADWWMLAAVLCEKSDRGHAAPGGARPCIQAELREAMVLRLPQEVRAQLEARLPS